MEDNIEFTATDGTNSLSFVLQVKVTVMDDINGEIELIIYALLIFLCSQKKES